ncbi:uncharacterized protein LOC123524506 [Mercenaria mercenaria]|uniref:uncharacterized protein LOC123524506 n=1 Tax=Mercenaria mercenaria TaxID=6596 RepID=UPI00234F2822|nr:uncharacterized protein LOC123524506 [Mercenaria mercenaria]
MRLANFLTCHIVVLVCFCLKPVQANNEATSQTNEADKFELLLERIELLERRNVETEKKMEQMQHDFTLEKRSLTDRIAGLEKLENLRNGDNAHTNVPDRRQDAPQDDEKFKDERIDQDPGLKQTRINKSGPARVRRASVESEAAFFATVTPHDIQHLGENQNIVFDNAVTNIGNAYHTNHGIFTAPVDGTYVFCATVAGRHYTDGKDYYAHFDVNGKSVANFIAYPNEQSTQMIIVNLQSGDDVSVKNNRADDHILGATWTSFSGFLLYQNFVSSTNVLG